MSHPEDDVDVLIREALGQADARLFDQLGEPTLPEMITGVFKGRRRLDMTLMVAAILLFFGASIFCAVRFVQATELRLMLLWGAGFFLCWTSMIGFKLVSWMEMYKNTLAREMKRLELQVAQLAAQMRTSE
jgi:hypothetical protein